ncbi:RCC1 domain-containing protein [Actinopolymorpha rutila]|uniref:Alpha-tubulin suppressor-like RCC1 family protein n=1 Tax=Actinopolymorpha rutila TaxID=446787 RepID=A0A852Z611_9ACTN|nr:cell wall anchor protein [Actinopolymorpha rutila]NYH87655.1 alpha-tubulin suppressor-like RCC1 family protein [Actinopolymorpha rutila]
MKARWSWYAGDVVRIKYGLASRGFVNRLLCKPKFVGRGLAGGLLALFTALLSVGATPATAQTAGDALSWGAGGSGQLGVGSLQNSALPLRPLLPTGAAVTAIAAGAQHGVAVTTRGVFAWGGNDSGQLGNGDNLRNSAPVNVVIPPGTFITAVAAGDEHTLALTSTGQVLAWGSNRLGQLGNPSIGPTSNVPVRVALPPGVTVVGVAAGDFHSLAVTSTGGVLAWGSNEFGQLGNGTDRNESRTPVPVSLPPGTAVTSVTAGGMHSVARTVTGGVLTWGLNDAGQLGDGTNDERDAPVPVTLPAGTVVTEVASGVLASHTLALTSAGQVLAWGSNQSGQLGRGNQIGSNVPVPTALPASTVATAIAAAGVNSVAVTASGQVLSWGDNSLGQAGDGAAGGINALPVQASLPANTSATDVAAGNGFNLVVSQSTNSQGPDTGDGATAAGGPRHGLIVGGVLALALAWWAGAAIRRGNRRRLAPTS